MNESCDHIHLLAPIRVGPNDVSLEIELHGAWVDGTYHPRSERTPEVVRAIGKLRELVLTHGRDT